ncbi:MAG TPA: alkaline phosphatase family protein [Gemmatimonadales bacterium]|nr:alkaline phosphatase family protein [Gemmatimonadales bacterium]
MLALAGLMPGQRPASPAPSPVSLVVLVVVDQMRADYLARFASQWSGGFGRIYRGGTVFEHGEQDHAATETAPGHATLLSGRYPAHTGIVLNSRGVQDADAPLVGRSGGEGASPRRFRGTTLVDWMLARDPGTRVLSVSRKDRGAIFPIGRATVPVYWFDAGAFTTSRYYADSLPAWVQAFNDRGSVDRLAEADATWNLLLPDSAYAERDSEPFENGGADYTFPHRFPTARGAALSQIARFPWMDSLTLAFALEGVRALGLGHRTGPDLLSISLSTTDAVGHAFGPDSRELHDQLLHVDRWLGRFLDSLTQVIGNDRVLLVLTGDHGVTPLPEYNVTVLHRPGGRVWLGSVARSAVVALRERVDRDFGLEFDSGLLSADVASLRASGIDVDSLAQALAAEAARLPGVARVYTPRTLTQAPRSDRSAELWRRLLPADYGWLFCAVTKEGYVWSGGQLGAEHSSGNREDIEVPIAFFGPGVPARLVERPASTVDIAPTLAALLRISPMEPLDGRVLREVLTLSPSP